MCAAVGGNSEGLRALIEGKADVNQQGENVCLWCFAVVIMRVDAPALAV